MEGKTMEITEVRISLKDGQNTRLRAYATVTFDNAFVVRNIKVIEGRSGLFVAMPSRKIKENCPKCGHKNVIRSKFCNECGAKLEVSQAPVREVLQGEESRQSEHKDIAHPITAECREYIQKKVLEAYEKERGRL
jgi:stage V sporulation protein G